MRQALCRVAAALRGRSRPPRRQRCPAGMFREVPFSPEPLFYGCAPPKKRNHSEARQAFAPGPSPRLLAYSHLCSNLFFVPLMKVFGKRTGTRGKEKSPFSKGFSPSPRSSSLSSLKKSCAEGESEGSAQRGGAAGAAVLLQWVSRRGRRRSGTWCLRRGS